MKSLIEDMVADLSEATFYKELCFTRQIFAPEAGKVKELADVLIWLETETIVFQVKERTASESNNEASVQQWFDRKVLRNGSDQIAATLAYLRDHAPLTVQNSRGQSFRLGDFNTGRIFNVITYGSLQDMPETLPKLHVSKRSGPIHLIKAQDLSELLRLTVTPGEMIRYLDFREAYLRRHEFSRRKSERWLFGRYVENDAINVTELDQAAWDGEEAVSKVVDDVSAVDLRQFIDYIGAWASGRDKENIVYKLMLEIAHLSRASMREFKKRVVKCMDRLDKPMPETLYSMVNPARDCTFVFGVSWEPDIPQAEQTAAGFTFLNLGTYKNRTRKGVGLFFTKVANEQVGTTPIYINRPWEKNEETDSFLAGNDPFRPLKKTPLFSYRTRSEIE